MARRTFSTIILAALLSSPLITVAAPKTELLPEVAAILQVQKPDEALLKQDGYVGLIAINAPEGMDYMAIGSRAVLESLQALQQALVKHNKEWGDMDSDDIAKYYRGKEPLKTPRFSYNNNLFPCGELDNHDCIAEILALKEDIAADARLFAKLMRRYLEIQKMPYLKAYGNTLDGAVPDFDTVLFLTRLRVDEAVLAFDAEKINEGFDLLSQEMRFIKSLLTLESEITDAVFATAILFHHYHVISELLDIPLLHPYLNDERLTGLLHPLTQQEQKAISNVVKYRRNDMVLGSFAYNDKLLQQQLEEAKVNNLLPDPLADLQKLAEQIDRKKLANITYLSFRPTIDSAAIPIHEAVSLQTWESHREMAIPVLEAQFALPENAANSSEKAFLMESISVGYVNELIRFYNLQIYQAMVQTKLRLLQSGIDTGNAAAVTAFLADAELRNPYTHQPFNWDPDQRMIWTQRLSEKYNYTNQRLRESKERLAVRVL